MLSDLGVTDLKRAAGRLHRWVGSLPRARETSNRSTTRDSDPEVPSLLNRPGSV